MYYHPNLAYVNSKSLIIALCYKLLLSAAIYAPNTHVCNHRLRWSTFLCKSRGGTLDICGTCGLCKRVALVSAPVAYSARPLHSAWLRVSTPTVQRRSRFRENVVGAREPRVSCNGVLSHLVISGLQWHKSHFLCVVREKGV